MDKKYYIGLDIGTESIGWAVTDENYNLVKQRGRDFWGVYLFEEAKTAQSRRQFRSSRRRIARTRQRINLLQNLFAEEISKVDPAFFIRLKNSPLFLEDKDETLKTKNVLFNDAVFSDKDYHWRFPTVYHLRNYLLTNKPDDIRFLYIALHHIIKNRGHFLFEGQSFDVKDTNSIIEKFDQINAYLGDNEQSKFDDMSQISAVLDVIKDNRLNKTEKAKRLQNLLNVSKDLPHLHLQSAIKAIVGAKTKLSVLYPNYAGEDIDFSFENDSFETDALLKIETAVGIDDAGFVRDLKAIYDWSVLSNILGNEQYISSAKIKIYNKHAVDLKKLKELVRSQDDTSRTLYQKIFKGKKGEKINNYAAYIGMDQQHRCKRCTKEEFYKYLKANVQLTDDILKDIENGDFLPKQVSNANGVIPYQVHHSEMMAILQNASKYYPFLLEDDGSGSIIDKISQLMTFRIPYYVGPLHTGKFSWAVRNEGYENVSITPWNFNKAINKDQSEQVFIRRMTNKCTYLFAGDDNDVLPASSFLYSEYAFLNELNCLKIYGERNQQAKELIFQYAHENKKVTLSGCLKLLKQNNLIEKDAKKEDVFSGIDGDFKQSLSSYVAFKGIIGDLVDTHSEMCEQIIEWITTTADKNRLEKRIKAVYGDILTNEQIKQIKSLNYVNWGRLSRKLLTGIYSEKCFDENGELISIIQAMRKYCKNFMEIYYNYNFDKVVYQHNIENTPTNAVTYQTVEDLYCSPAVKRAIWRSIELVREVVKVMGCEPQKVFVEMARESNDNGKKGTRTSSRKQQILELYKGIKEGERDWIAEISKWPDSKFDSKRLYLYYRQKGRSMYSGRPITLEQAFDKNICDVDHIYPQSKIKDDSFDNLVLVYRTENATKTDIYPISAEIQNKMIGFWSKLKDQGFISKSKYEKLVRKTPLTNDELADFINRQLVQTRQSTKLVTDLLARILPNSKIVFSKASNADAFKHEHKLVKVRELNDLHHAKDAFVNIVAGNVWYTKFQGNAKIFLHNNHRDSYNFKYLYAHDIPGAWKVAEKKHICNIYNKNTCRVVRFTSTGKGQLFNATLYSPKDNLIPLKEKGALSNPQRYGGYDSASTAYFMLVKGKDKKGKTVLSIETVSIYQDMHFRDGRQTKQDYLKTLDISNCEIVVDNIKTNTLFCINGSYAYIRGKTGKQLVVCNANELHLDDEMAKYLKIITNCFDDKKKYFLKELPIKDVITLQGNLQLYDTFIEKLSSPIYAGLSIAGQVETLTQGREKFIALSLDEQLNVLIEVLKLMQCNSATSNLVLVGGSANAGKILINKQIQDKQVKIITQSPTGHYRKVIDCTEFLK